MNIIESLVRLRDEYRGYADENDKDGDEDARDRNLLVAFKLDAIIAAAREEPEGYGESVLASLADCINEIARQAGTGEVQSVSLGEIREAMWRVEYRRLSLKQECDDLRLNRAAFTSPTAPKAEEWRGPVRCNKCYKVYGTAPSEHYWSWNEHPYPRELCDGKFVPYERRRA